MDIGRDARRSMRSGRHAGDAGPPGGKPQGAKCDATGDPGMVTPDPERQGAGRPGTDVQPVYPRLDQLLQPILQIGPVSDASSARRLPRQMGAAQVQATSAEVEGCSGLAPPGGPHTPGAGCPLGA